MTHRLDYVSRVLRRVTYKDWRWNTLLKGASVHIQVAFNDKDGEEHTGRKWYVSSHATDSEIVQTALAAILAAEEHEARELFLVDGVACFGPHFSVDDLVDLASRRGAAGARP